jgi:hypothetical protein
MHQRRGTVKRHLAKMPIRPSLKRWIGRGFSRTHTILILLAFVLSFAWMIWLVVVA